MLLPLQKNYNVLDSLYGRVLLRNVVIVNFPRVNHIYNELISMRRALIELPVQISLLMHESLAAVLNLPKLFYVVIRDELRLLKSTH